VFFTRPDAVTGRVEGIDARIVKSERVLADRPGRWVPDAMYLRRVLSGLRPDVVHINDDIYSAVPAILAAGMMGIPVVCHLRSERKPTRVEKLIAPLCRRFVAICEAGAKYYRRNLPGVGRRIELITDSFTRVEPGRDLRPGKRMTIGMLSNLGRGKGHEHVIAAMPRILRAFPGARLVIAGSEVRDDGYAGELRLEAERLGIVRAVEFAGWVEDVSGFLGGMDILVDASYLHEGFRHTIVEGMQGGVPVIATDVGAVREIISSDEEGVVIPPGSTEAIADAVCALLGNPRMMGEIANGGRAAAEVRLRADGGTGRMERLLRRTAARRQ
jgi:glycosyltransferase involved in cell wall biosynthesis